MKNMVKTWDFKYTFIDFMLNKRFFVPFLFFFDTKIFVFSVFFNTQIMFNIFFKFN